jgi:hypothetical protein
MNWDMISAIGEILGSAAVLVTLIYLTVQTRQNTNSIQANTRQAVLEADMQYLWKIVDNPELIALRLKSDISDMEKTRFGAYLLSFLRIRENLWFQHQNGVLDDTTWESYRRNIAPILADPRSRKFWTNFVVNSQRLDSKFIALVDDLLADTPLVERNPLVAAFD